MTTGKFTALVTGGGRRLGSHISISLAASGYDVAINYNKSRSEAEETADRIRTAGGTASTVRGDVSDAGQVADMISAVENNLGSLRLLVNNAAVFPPSSFRKLTEDVWDRTLDVNLKGTYLCCKAAGDRMLEAGGGKIINIACLGGFQPWPGHIAYSVSKAGVIMLTRALAKSLAPSIQVNAVAPGTVRVDNDSRSAPLHPPEETIPMARYATPADICDAVLYFACGTGYVTGQVLLVDGGTSLQSIW